MNRMTWRVVLSVVTMLAIVPAVTGKDDDDVRKMQRATARAKISLSEAIEIAQREVPGGKPIEVELEWRRGGPRIEVELLAGNLWKDVVIDAVSGKVLAVVDDVVDDADDQEELKRDQANWAAATRTFAEALAMAEKETEGGKAVEIELTAAAGKPIFKVELLVGDKLIKRHIPATRENK